MKSIGTLALFTVIITYGCTSGNETTSDRPPSLEGTWNLMEAVPHAEGLTEWRKNPDSILYQKHLTKNQFTWFSYDTKANRLIGMGGGDYEIKDGKYVENIKFFYPPTSSELGQAIPFDYEVSNGVWYHTGYAKEMEMDMETGDMVVVDSSKIEEKWSRSKRTDQKNPLTGSWKLISYRDGIDGNMIEYPPFVGYIKLITPTNFTWVYFNKDGDEIYAAGSGTYSYKGDTYTETIQMIYPENTGQIDESISFNAELNEGQWNHLGFVPQVSIDSASGVLNRDSLLIDEVWKPYNGTM